MREGGLYPINRPSTASWSSVRKQGGSMAASGPVQREPHHHPAPPSLAAPLLPPTSRWAAQASSSRTVCPRSATRPASPSCTTGRFWSGVRMRSCWPDQGARMPSLSRHRTSRLPESRIAAIHLAEMYNGAVLERGTHAEPLARPGTVVKLVPWLI